MATEHPSNMAVRMFRSFLCCIGCAVAFLVTPSHGFVVPSTSKIGSFVRRSNGGPAAGVSVSPGACSMLSSATGKAASDFSKTTANRGRQTTSSTTSLSSTAEPETETPLEISSPGMIGDDAAYFSFEDQKLDEWIKFTAATGTVLAAVSYLWFIPSGPHFGDAFLETIQSTLGTTDPAVTVFSMLSVFAFFHSGLAALRPYSEEIIGPRAHRVVFAVVSLPLALSCISYFVNHCHEGTQFWDVTDVPGLHAALWITNFASFLLLYPSTFNLLEIAAIQSPQLHLWETGVTRITRHPQAIGQIMWCAAHSLWLGTSTALAASSMLVAHHVFSMYHGDYRLKQRHGDAFEEIKKRTSVVPFAAILDGRQELPDDYYKEFLRGPYFLVVGGTIAAYFAHPFMQAGAALLNW